MVPWYSHIPDPTSTERGYTLHVPSPLVACGHSVPLLPQPQYPTYSRTPAENLANTEMRSDVKSSRTSWPQVQNFVLGLGLKYLSLTCP